MNKNKIIIIDDEPIMTEGLESWLSEQYETLAFNSAEAFLETFSNFDFEDSKQTCILLDFQLPGMNGVELQETLTMMNLKFPIVFMSGNAKQIDIIEAWRGGAVDFILKPFNAQQINEILATQFARLGSFTLTSKDPKTTQLIKLSITKREAEVLTLLAQGRQQIEVAQILGLSLRTVKMYRTFLKNKLGLNSLIELARFYDKHKQSINATLNKNKLSEENINSAINSLKNESRS